MAPKRAKKKASASTLEELYGVLRENDYRKVLEMGQEQLGTATDKLAVLEAMIDAIENMLFEDEVVDPAPLRALEQALRDERQRLTDSGATSDVYKKFLDSSYGTK